MRKLTLEERVARLEDAISSGAKNEATRSVIMSIPAMVRSRLASDETLSEYVNENSSIKIKAISMPARARRNDAYNEVNFDLGLLQPCSDRIADIANDIVAECLEENGLPVDYTITTGGRVLMCTVVLKTNIKPMYYKPGKDTDASWETGLEPGERRDAEYAIYRKQYGKI